MTSRQTSLLYAIALSAGLAALYAFGINNQLIFDDARLADGSIFGRYGSLLTFKARLLSYGSFVWIQSILGEGWWKQRILNIGLHIATALALYALVLELLRRTQWSQENTNSAAHSSSLVAAARIGVALWAFNPVAVYAVAYLIQRSIVMASLLVVLACWNFVQGLVTGKKHWRLLAFVCYLLAVASKEYAVTAILLAVPLYVFVQRPSLQHVLKLTAAAVVLLAAVGALLYLRYGAIIGNVFDETSRAFALQLELQQPGISQQLYPLSIINQASLFFQYGQMWLLPYVGWMSIDLRPSFPLTLWGWHALGALAWIGSMALSAWWLLRRNDALGLLGLCLLIPGLLFVTEFSTVWLQDPFVLYRSYLWSLSIPLLIALPLVGVNRNKVYVIGLLLTALLAALSFERINSLQSPSVAWQDASAKIDRHAPANAVGRWRPLLNQGAEALDKGIYDDALRLFSQAEELGEPLGSARFNMGVSLQQLKKYAQALDNFALAEAKGFKEAALYYQRGEAQFALRRFAEAYASFSQALQHPQGAEAEQFTQLRQAEAAVGSQNFDAAIASYQSLIQKSPDRQRYKVGLSMAYVGKADFVSAIKVLDDAIAQRPTGAAYYARAFTQFKIGNRAASSQDVELALRAEPNNPVYRGLQQQLAGSASPSAAQPAKKP